MKKVNVLLTDISTYLKHPGQAFRKVCEVTLIYVIFLLVSLLFCLYFPSENLNENIAFFFGVAGTLASLFSIVISARDDIRSERESLKNETFLGELSKKVSFLQSDTITVKNDLQCLLNSKSQSNLSTDDPSEEGNKEPNDWGQTTDEIPPT